MALKVLFVFFSFLNLPDFFSLFSTKIRLVLSSFFLSLYVFFGSFSTDLGPVQDQGEPDGAEANSPRNHVLEAILSKRTKKN